MHQATARNALNASVRIVRCRIESRLKLSSQAQARLKHDSRSSDSTLPKPRLDYRSIIDNVVFKSHNAFNRKATIPVGTFPSLERLYQESRDISRQLAQKRSEQSNVGEQLRTASTDSRQPILQQAKAIKTEVHALEAKLGELDEELLETALRLPNDTHPDVPIGHEAAATLLSTRGPPRLPASPERDHIRIGSLLELFDFESGSTVAGSSWYYLKNEAALLELAIVNYALSLAIKRGFTPVTTPDVVKTDIAHRCGFQPREDGGAAQNYYVERVGDEPQRVLAGTAEIPLGGMFANKVFNERDLPKRVVGIGKAFRAEAGARGADTRGLYRVHQFTKVELFCVTKAEASDETMEDIRAIQQEMYDGLGIPYRILDMPTEELGSSAYRKYDMEAWMPGRGKWGEISSTSNCTDYQSRRLHIRYRPDDPSHQGLPFAHTLNGTAMAVPRIIIALIENGVRIVDGEVQGLDLPKALEPFWIGGPGRDVIGLRWV